LKILLALAATKDFKLRHLDVRTAYLNGDLEETIYMKQPRGFMDTNHPNHVWRLKKSLYGLRQAGRQWNEKLVEALLRLGFRKLVNDPSVFVLNKGRKLTILACYVDDLLLLSNNDDMLERLVTGLGRIFDISDLDFPNHFLGLQIKHENGDLQVSQVDYIKNVVKRYGDQRIKPRSLPMSPGLKLMKEENVTTDFPYRSAVGSVMYAMTGTRPDIAYSVGVLSRHMASHGETHVKAMEYLLGYLKARSGRGLVYRKGGSTELVGYCDSSYNDDPVTRRSTSGYVFTINGTAVSWASKVQRTASGGGTTEAEFCCMLQAVKVCIWIRHFMSELGFPPSGPTPIYCDNAAAVIIANGEGYGDGQRHYLSWVAFVRDHINNGTVTILHKPTGEMPADVFTKALCKAVLRSHITRFGMNA
jgi:hypothetical protein